MADADADSDSDADCSACAMGKRLDGEKLTGKWKLPGDHGPYELKFINPNINC